MKTPTSPAPVGIHWRPIVLINIMFVVNGLGYFMAVAPQTQLFENIVCDAYNDSSKQSRASANDHPSSKNPCKTPPVQETLAMLFGLQAMFDGVPGLLLALPYGVAADKIGRKPVLLLSMIGQALGAAWVVFVCWYNLPLRLIWVSSAFTLLGGGNTVAAAVCMMVITDAAAEEYRPKLFFSLQGSFILMEIIGPPVGAFLMERDLWIPILLGLLCSLITTCLATLMPETLTMSTQAANQEDDAASHKDQHFTLATIKSWANHCFATVKFVLRERRVAYLVGSFLVVDFGRQSLTLLLQYVSERFGWPLAKTSYLLSLRASGQLLLFMLILPAVDSCVMRRTTWPVKEKDFRLANISIWLLTISFIAFAFAPNVSIIILGLLIYTLGTGFNTFARSLVSALVEPTMIGTLYTTLSVMDTAGSMLAGPLVAQTFKWGMAIGGVWHGLPYMLSLMLCGLGALLLSRVHLQRAADDSAEAGEEALLRGDEAAESQ